MSDVLAVSALGDAMGVPYEFQFSDLPPDAEHSFKMPNNWRDRSGSWSDDTSMALAIAVAAERHDIRSSVGLDAMVKLFKAWEKNDGFGIGRQTREVLNAVPSSQVNAFAKAVAASEARFEGLPNDSAGNGSLMRIHPVALLPISDDDAVLVSKSVTVATHADPLCLEASVLWIMMMRHALSTGGDFKPNVGIDFIPSEKRDLWNGYILEALTRPSYDFGLRGWWVVPSFQQALSAVHKNLSVLDREPVLIFREILECGKCDSDTICCIAGGLMGALGVQLSQFPTELTEPVWGAWPKDLKLTDLQRLEASLRGSNLYR